MSLIVVYLMNPEDSSGSGVGKEGEIDTEVDEKGQRIMRVSKRSSYCVIVRVSGVLKRTVVGD